MRILHHTSHPRQLAGNTAGGRCSHGVPALHQMCVSSDEGEDISGGGSGDEANFGAANLKGAFLSVGSSTIFCQWSFLVYNLYLEHAKQFEIVSTYSPTYREFSYLPFAY